MAQQFIEIADNDVVTPWQFKNPETGVTFASTFLLRVVPSDEQRRLRKRHTKYEFVRGARQENFDWAAFSDDCLDYAVVDWREVKQRGQDLPCERFYKLLLPEAVKQEITRLCLGKELGQVQGSDEGGEIAADEEGEQRPRPTLSPVAPMPKPSLLSGPGSSGSPTTDPH